MARLGIVTALAPEAAILRRGTPGTGAAMAPILRLSGPGLDSARFAAQALIAEGATALLCFGLAGGLDAALRPGDVVLADRIVGPDRVTLAADPDWRDRLLRASRNHIDMKSGDIASVAQPLKHPGEKAALFEELGAIALDMESYGVAGVARDADVPFLGIRAIADPASRSVPEAAIRTMGPDGQTQPLAALAALFANPAEFWNFVKLARDGRAAFAALRRVALLGPGFGLV